MKTVSLFIFKPVVLVVILIVCSRCINEFVPDINEENELLVVEGLITDQPETCTIKISKSLPVGLKSDAKPLSGCIVTVSDNTDVRTRFNETEAGTYISPPEFRGMVGKTYKVHITAPSGSEVLNYDSEPAEMLPVPPISDLYYEKIKLRDVEPDLFDVDGCQIYLTTYDLSGNNYFRWEYFETWVLRLPYIVPNQICWVSDRSRNIMIKSNANYGESRMFRQPVVFISDATDRLKTKYSILVNQYSLNQDEYNFWVELQNLTEQSGGLYDVIPASIASNIKCVEKPEQNVLGYFSVSAKSSQRIFIDEEFAGIVNLYKNCVWDTVYGDGVLPGQDTTVWVLLDKPQSFFNPRTRILTKTRGCYDCTERGTKVKPSFWIGD